MVLNASYGFAALEFFAVRDPMQTYASIAGKAP
jgi:hypothetical protein